MQVLYNPHHAPVTIKRQGLPDGVLTIPPFTSVELSSVLRIILGNSITFFKLQVRDVSPSDVSMLPVLTLSQSEEESVHHDESRTTITEESPTISPSTNNHIHTVFVDENTITSKVSPEVERPSIILDDGTRVVSGDTRTHEELSTSETQELFYATSESSSREDHTQVFREEAISSTQSFTISTEDFSSSAPVSPLFPLEGAGQSTSDGIDTESLTNLLRNPLFSSSVETSSSEIHFIPATLEEPDSRESDPGIYGSVNALNAWLEELEQEEVAGEPTTDIVDPFASIPHIYNTQLVEKEFTPSIIDVGYEVAKECPYTSTQLQHMVKSRLIEVSQQLGLDPNGSKKELIEKILQYYGS